MKKKRYFKLLFVTLLLLNSVSMYSEVPTMEELIEFKKRGLISEEDFKVLKAEINNEQTEEKNMYDLNINSRLTSRAYKVIGRDNKNYLPVKEFFKNVGFSNYTESKGELTAHLGSALREVSIKLKDNPDVIIEGQDVYLESQKFTELFLKNYNIDSKELKLRMYLAFDTPNEIVQLLDIESDKLKRKKDEEELVYSSKRKLFDLGYVEIDFGLSYDKAAGEKSYKSDWDGNIAYQGGLLYGEFSADFDVREGELGTVRLEYADIWKEHNFEIENRNAGDSREWGLVFYKDKGYYETSGGQVVIRENVPLGSRAELIYMGTSIEIKDDDNGVVEFDNPLIRTDKTYVLKIYQPDGKITEKEIQTAEDYNLQGKGQFEYRMAINENSEYDKYSTNLEVFYGVTKDFTIGFGYSGDLEELSIGKGKEQKVKYLNNINLDLVYGGTYNGLSYTFNLSGEKTLDSLDAYVGTGGTEKEISLSKRYSYRYLNQFNYKKWKFIYEYEGFGSFHDEKNRNKFDLEYDLFKNVDIGYEYEMTKYRYGQEKEVEQQVTIDADYSWNKFLFSAGAAIDIEESSNTEYRASVYYSGWERLTARLENVISDHGKEYEATLELYNNNYKGFLDFSTEVTYSNIDKDKFTFNVSLKLDDWLTIDNDFSDDGARSHRVGIDKVIDLKNPRVDINGMDNSRVKVIAFVDSNNNNLYDKNEELASGIEVKIGNDKIITDEKGTGMFYGIGNGSVYDMDVKIKKPSFTLGKNILKIKSDFSSTVEAYIPIKPMLTLKGSVLLDQELKLVGDEKAAFYNDLIIELKDLKGNVVETAIADDTGMFDISGLLPKDYYIEVTYIGTKYDLETIKEEIELQYSKENSTNVVLLKISNDHIAINLPKDSNNMAKLDQKGENNEKI